MYAGKHKDENTMFINEYGYHDVIAEMRERQRRDDLNTEKLKRTQNWKGKGKRKMPRN